MSGNTVEPVAQRHNWYRCRMAVNGETIRKRYLTNVGSDLVGGLMAAIVALPLCLAFGVASGLGAAAGLYGAIACGIFAALFGGTPGQCSGPTGPMTVVAAAMFAATPDNPSLVFAAVMAAGILQIALGYLKAGQLIEYIPYPVISGFMTGIGAIIISIQILPLFGLPGSGSVLSSIRDLPKIFSGANTDAFVIGSSTLALIYLLPRLSRRLPVLLIALVATTSLSLLMHMDIPRIGSIPSGFPMPQLPVFGFTDIHVVLQNAMTLALLGAIDSLLTSLVMDKVTGGRHDSDKELIGQGIGNMFAGLIGGIPGAGATMRSMVNVKAGGRTHLSGAVHGLILLAVLLGLGNVASLIPLSALAGILITVGISIMDWRALRAVHRTPRSDVAVMVVVLLLTVFVDLIIAVGVGVAMASILFVKRLADARLSEVGTVDALEELHQLAGHLPSDVRKSIYTYQFNGPLFFGEAKNLTQVVDKLEGARYVILRFYNVPLVDQTGAYALEDAVERWESRGIKVLFVGMQPHIRHVLDSTGAIHKIGMENCFDQFEDAIKAIDAFEAELAAARAREQM
ncbi:MAG TPA: SulP family inorganic anion transporter [Candidatus Obscuribacterales bacterium]